MTGDVKKIVDIVLQVSGADKKQIEPLSKALTDLQATINEITTDFGKLKKSIGDLKVPKGLSDLKAQFESLKDLKVPNIKGLSDGLAKLEKFKESTGINSLIPQLQKLSEIQVDNSINRMVNGLNRLIKLDVNKVSAQVQSLSASFEKLQEQGKLGGFATFAQNVSSLQNAFQQTAKSADSLTKSFANVNNTAQQSKKTDFINHLRLVAEFRAISDIILLVRNTITGGINAILEYDQALKNLQAITGATGIEVNQMGQKILEVALTTKFSASEIAEGMTIIGQAGFSASESIQVMSAIANLATGTLSSMAETVDLMTSSLRVFNIDATRAAEVADIFAVAVNASKLTIEQIKVAMNYLGPVSQDAGMSLREVSAAMMTLSNVGLRPSTIGTGLRQVIAELVDPTEKFKQAVRDAGLSLDDVTPGVKNMSEVISNLGLVVTDTGKAFDLFDKRGASALLALSANKGQNFNAMLDSLNESGVAARQAAKQMEGVQVSFKNVVNSLGVLAVTLGKSGIIEGFRLIADAAKYMVDIFIQLVDNAFARFIITTVSVTAAIFTIGAALGGLGFVVTVLIGKLKFLAVGITALSGISVGFVPLLGAITVLIGLLTGVSLLFKDTAQAASESAKIAADSYGDTAKKIQDYNLEVLKFKEGSEESKQAALSLRNQLLQVANGSGIAAKGAREVVDSIDPMNGEFTKGIGLLQDYNRELLTLQTEKLKESLESATESLRDQGHIITQVKNDIIDTLGSVDIFIQTSIKSLKNLGNLDFKGILNAWSEGLQQIKQHGKNSEEALDLSEAFRKNEIGIEEFEKRIAKWDKTKLGKTQTDLIESLESVKEAARNAGKNLEANGKIDLKDTIKNFENAAKEAGFSERSIESVTLALKKMKEDTEKFPSNVVEKWEKENDPKFLTKLIDGFTKLGGTITDTDKEVLEGIENNRQALIQKQKDLKAEFDKNKSVGQERIDFLKEYARKEAEIEKEKDTIVKSVSFNKSAQQLQAYGREKENLDKHLAEIRQRFANSDNTDLMNQQLEKAEIESEKITRRIWEGPKNDPKEQAKLYEKQLNERETLHAEHLLSISTMEAKRTITEEQALKRKNAADASFYQESALRAKEYRDQIVEAENPDEYEKRNKLVLDAEKKLYEEKAKYSIDSIKMDDEIQKQKIENSMKISEKIFQNTISSQQEATKALEKEIQQAYDAEQISIEEFYSKKRDLEEELTLNQKEEISNRMIEVEKEFAEKIKLSNSEKDRLSLEGELKEKILELTNRKTQLELKEKTTLNDLNVEEQKALEISRKKVDALLLEIQKKKDQSFINRPDTTMQDKYDYELKIMQAGHMAQIQQLLKNKAEIEDILKAVSDQEIEIKNFQFSKEEEMEKARVESERQFTEDMANITKGLMDSGLIQSKRAFKIFQAFSIAEAMISTYSSAQTAYDKATKMAPFGLGNIFGSVAAAAAIAAGLAKVAMIKAQNPGYAQGGLIKGYSAHSKSDNIDIRATAGEYMQPVSAVQKYGVRVMNAIRSLQIPKESLMNLISGSSYGLMMPKPSTFLASGGLVPSAVSSGPSQTIVNLNNQGLPLTAEYQRTTKNNHQEVIDIVLHYTNNNIGNFQGMLKGMLNR